MSHEIESAMYVKKPAWHKLGNVLTEAPDTATALEKSGLDWRVDLRALSLDMTPTEMNAIVRDTDKRILGYCMGRYEAYQNPEAFGWTDPLVQSGLYQYEAAGSLRQGEKAWILLRQGQQEVVTGDKLDNFLLYTWGHDGRTPVQCGPTTVRVVCANTLRMALNGGSEFRKVRHTGTMRLSLEEVKEMYLADARRFEKQADWFKRLLDRPISLFEREQYISAITLQDSEKAQSERQKRRSERVTEFLGSMAAGRASGSDIPGIRDTAYGLFMAVSESIEHYMGGDKVKDRGDNILFGQGARQLDKASAEMDRLLSSPVGQYTVA